jgi:hypothetical protein
MIFWLVLKLEISYSVIISWRILVSFRGFFEDYIFACGNVWISIWPRCDTPLVFTLWYLIMFWDHVMHVLDMLWVLRVYNMSLGMICAPWNIHNMKSYECKMRLSIIQFVLENMNGAKGRMGKKLQHNFCIDRI